MAFDNISRRRLGCCFGTALFSFLCLSLPHETLAGAWTAKQGASYNKFAVNYFFSDESFDDDGDRQSADSDFTDLNFSYYMEYGVLDNVTLFLSIPFKRIESEPDNANGSITTRGIGDQEYGIRYNLYNGDKGVFSVQGLVKVPDLNDDDDDLPLGNDQVDYELRLLYGKSLYPKPVYFGLEAGYRYRSDAPSDEIRYLAEVGYTMNEKVYLRTKLDGTLSVDNADNEPVTLDNPTLTTAFDVGKLELTGGYKIDKRKSAEFTWTPNIYGQNTAAGNNFQFAIIFQLP